MYFSRELTGLQNLNESRNNASVDFLEPAQLSLSILLHVQSGLNCGVVAFFVPSYWPGRLSFS